MKADVTFKLHPENVSEVIGRITDCVLTHEQNRNTTFRASPAAFTVRTNDVMSLLGQFEAEGFDLESSFQEVTIRPAR